MSLRVKLFVLFGGLLVALVAGEWLLLRSLSRDVTVEVATVASSVGEQVVRVFTTREGAVKIPLPGSGEPGSPAEKEVGTIVLPEPGGSGHERRVVVTTLHVETGPAAADGRPAPPGTAAPTPGAGKPTWFAFRSETLSGKAPPVLVVEGPHLKRKIPIPSSGVREALDRFRQRLLLGSLTLLGVGLVAAAIAADRVSRPLRDLSRAAREVGQGTFGVQAAPAGGGEVGEAIAAFNQMSARLARLEAEALALKEREHLGELGEVARGMAHSLRNPLHAIGLTLDEMAGRLADDPGAAEVAESARRQIRRVDGSIRGFLALAASGAGSVEEVDLGAVARDVVLTALQDARGRVRIELEAPDGGGPRIRGIAPELAAVVQALVVNAVEASPDGATVRVRVAAAEEGRVALEVEDDGPGLPAEVRERLFTPHVTTKPAGSGMGLFLAHRIAVSRYGGELALHDRAPRGTAARLVAGPRKEGAGA